MTRSFGLYCAIAALLISSSESGQRFSKYKAITAFDTGVGIILFPRYSHDGEICEVTLEKQHYSKESVDLDPTLPRDKIIEIVNVIAPEKERGKNTTPFGREYLSKYSGNSVTTFAEYEKVSIQIYGRPASTIDTGDIVARVLWKKRACN